MNIKKLRETIEKKDDNIIEKYEELFETDLHTLIEAIRKINNNFTLTTWMQYAPMQQNNVNNDRYTVFYDIVFKDVVLQVANKDFSVKEKDLDEFLEKAKTEKVLSTIKVNLVRQSHSNIRTKKGLLSSNGLSIKTSRTKDDKNNKKVHKILPWLNDVLWSIVEKNCDILQDRVTRQVISEITQRKQIASHFKEDIKTLKTDIACEDEIIKNNPQDKKSRNTQKIFFEQDLKEKQEYLKQEKGIIKKLNTQKCVLETKDAKSDLSILFGKK